MKYLQSFLLPITVALFSCQEEKPPECFSFNETTISLQSASEGKIPSYELVGEWPSDQILAGPAINFVNQTHQLGTQPLPKNLHVTRVPHYCGGDFTVAYAYTGDEWTQGIYFTAEFDPLRAIEVLSHEIGHFQPGGQNNEVMAELNMYEQRLMAYALFAKSEGNDILRWAYRNSGLDGYLSHLSNAVDDDVGDTNSTSTTYTNADIFFFFKL